MRSTSMVTELHHLCIFFVVLFLALLDGRSALADDCNNPPRPETLQAALGNAKVAAVGGQSCVYRVTFGTNSWPMISLFPSTGSRPQPNKCSPVPGLGPDAQWCTIQSGTYYLFVRRPSAGKLSLLSFEHWPEASDVAEKHAVEIARTVFLGGGESPTVKISAPAPDGAEPPSKPLYPLRAGFWEITEVGSEGKGVDISINGIVKYGVCIAKTGSTLEAMFPEKTSGCDVSIMDKSSSKKFIHAQCSGDQIGTSGIVNKFDVDSVDLDHYAASITTEMFDRIGPLPMQRRYTGSANIKLSANWVREDCSGLQSFSHPIQAKQ